MLEHIHTYIHTYTFIYIDIEKENVFEEKL
jgi:hypothetical protein